MGRLIVMHSMLPPYTMQIGDSISTEPKCSEHAGARKTQFQVEHGVGQDRSEVKTDV